MDEFFLEVISFKKSYFTPEELKVTNPVPLFDGEL